MTFTNVVSLSPFFDGAVKSYKTKQTLPLEGVQKDSSSIRLDLSFDTMEEVSEVI